MDRRSNLWKQGDGGRLGLGLLLSFVLCLLLAPVQAASPPAMADRVEQPAQPTSPQTAVEMQKSKKMPTLRFSTLEWPPYSGARLAGQGETSLLLQRVFRQLGYQVQIDVMSWSDAVALVNQQQQGFRGFFPEYPLLDPRYIQTSAIGYSELGLVEPVQAPLLLTSVQQLARLRIGVVDGYLNMAELDRLIAAGQIRPVRNLSDRQNILQVAAGQLDAAVIDKRVLNYLLQHDAELKAVASQVQFSQSLTEHRSLHLVLPANPANQALVNAFNQQLASSKNHYIGAR